MRAGGVGRIAAISKDEDSQAIARKKGLKEGDWVSVMTGWQEWAKVPVKDLQKIE